MTNNCFLIDECGNLVNSWERNAEPGMSARLLENGLLLRTQKTNNTNFLESSSGGEIELIDWDNNLVGSYTISDEEIIQHHDALMMPNGNLLLLAWGKFTKEELEAYGAETDTLWTEVIYEIKLIDESQYEIVWEWHLKNHLIQNVNPTLTNYGIIENNIGKVDINYIAPLFTNHPDRWHCNALDYHQDLDQILINSRHNSELWILDHSTSIEEAASNQGGKSGMGGQLLYRWGNPEAYKHGDQSDLKMFGSHGTYWIPEGLPNAGKIMFFNNGSLRPEGNYSTIEMIDPIELDSSSYAISEEQKYFPLESELVYKADNPFDFKSTYLSNAQQLKNGNVFINEGGSSRYFEVNTNDNSIVWEYISPVYWDGYLPQGVNPVNNKTFRALNYSVDFSGFEDKDLNSQGPLEIDPWESICILDSNSDQTFELSWSVHPNPTENLVFINLSDDFFKSKIRLSIKNSHGIELINLNLKERNCEIDLSHFPPGIFYATIIKNDKLYHKKILKW